MKPNDEQALNLMNSCAVGVLKEFQDLVFAFGESDEYRYWLVYHIKLNFEENTNHALILFCHLPALFWRRILISTVGGKGISLIFIMLLVLLFFKMISQLNPLFFPCWYHLFVSSLLIRSKSILQSKWKISAYSIDSYWLQPC